MSTYLFKCLLPRHLSMYHMGAITRLVWRHGMGIIGYIMSRYIESPAPLKEGNLENYSPPLLMAVMCPFS